MHCCYFIRNRDGHVDSSALHTALRFEILRRIALGKLSNKLLAAKTGLSSPHISLFLAGKRSISAIVFDRLLVAAAIEISALLDDPAIAALDEAAVAAPPPPAEPVAPVELHRFTIVKVPLERCFPTRGLQLATVAHALATLRMVAIANRRLDRLPNRP